MAKEIALIKIINGGGLGSGVGEGMSSGTSQDIDSQAKGVLGKLKGEIKVFSKEMKEATSSTVAKQYGALVQALKLQAKMIEGGKTGVLGDLKDKLEVLKLKRDQETDPAQVKIISKEMSKTKLQMAKMTGEDKSAFGSVIGSAFKGLGIASVAGLIVSLVAQMQSLVSVVQAILKLVSFLLKPIADVVMVLLMPILYFLKPLVQAVNQVMAPFLKQAMKMMASGAKDLANGDPGSFLLKTMGAAGVIFQGFQVAIIVLLKDILKFILYAAVDLINQIFSPIFAWFGVDLGRKAEETKSVLGTIIDGTAGLISEGIRQQSIVTIEALGMSANNFKTDSAKVFTEIFSEAPDSLKNVWEEELNRFKDTGASKIREAVNAFNAEFERMRRAGQTSAYTPSGAGYSTSRPLNAFELALGYKYTDSNGRASSSKSASSNKTDNAYVGSGGGGVGAGGLVW